MGAGVTKRIAVFWLCLALLGLLGIAAATAHASADRDYGPNQAERALKRELKRQDLTLEQASCDRKRHGAVIVCEWTARGALSSGVDYECEEKARFVVAKRKWKGAKCDDPMVALLPELGPHPHFGYSDKELNYEIVASLLPGSGADVYRQILSWRLVDQQGWYHYDSLYQSLLRWGIRPLWVLHSAPCWAQPATSGCSNTCGTQPHPTPGCSDNVPPNPDHFDEFASFAAEAARRYPEAIGLEVWNEPNYRAFWEPDPDPQAYAQLLADVASAVHAANPYLPVVSAGLAPIDRRADSSGIGTERFLGQVYEAGGAQLADAIGAHPYPPAYDVGYQASIREQLFRYLRVMGRFNDMGKPVWVTETGVSSFETEGWGYAQQASALVDMYDLFRRIPNVPVVVFHRLADDPIGYPSEPPYGVATASGQPKPAYCAVAEARGNPCAPGSS